MEELTELLLDMDNPSRPLVSLIARWSLITVLGAGAGLKLLFHGDKVETALVSGSQAILVAVGECVLILAVVARPHWRLPYWVAMGLAAAGLTLLLVAPRHDCGCFGTVRILPAVKGLLTGLLGISAAVAMPVRSSRNR